MEPDLALLATSIRGEGLTVNECKATDGSEAYAAGFPAMADDQLGQKALNKIISAHLFDAALSNEGVDISHELEIQSVVADGSKATFTKGSVRRYAKQTWTKSRRLVEVVENDVPTSPGNSGGPLVDAGMHLIAVEWQET